MTLIRKARKGERMNTLENYHVQYFQFHNKIIQEQTIAKLNPLFQLTYNLRSRDPNPDPSTDSRTTI